MLDIFLYAGRAIMPLLLMMALGCGLRRAGRWSDDFYRQLNGFCFHVLLPVQLFLNVYAIEDLSVLNWRLLGFIVACIVGAAGLGVAVAPLFARDRGQRAVIAQATFRANQVIMGIPLASALGGEEALIFASLVTSVCVPVFNVLAVLVLACFFFQHSKATPVQPVEPVSSASEIPASSAEVSAESTQPQAVDSVSASDGLTFSLSAEMVHDKLSLKLDYGTVLFVVDPNASDITLQFDGFRTRYLTHSSEKAGTTEFSYHIPKYNALPDSDSALLTITVPENILHEVDIDLAMGDVDLGTLSLDELDLELAMGSVSADSLTVKDADFDLAMGGCHIDHLSAPEFDAELAMGDCTIGMLSGAQDVNISVTLGKAALTLEGSASDYTLVTNGLMGTSIQDGKANPSRKISLSTTTGDLSISYTN